MKKIALGFVLVLVIMMSIMIIVTGGSVFAALVNKIATAGIKSGDAVSAYRDTDIWLCPMGVDAQDSKFQSVYNCTLQRKLGIVAKDTLMKVSTDNFGEDAQFGYVYVKASQVQVKNLEGDLLFTTQNEEGWVSSDDIIQIPK